MEISREDIEDLFRRYKLDENSGIAGIDRAIRKCLKPILKAEEVSERNRARIMSVCRYNPSMCYAVYTELLSHNSDDNECYPSIERISEGVGCSHDTVNRCIRELERFGMVEVLREKKKVNRYYFPKENTYFYEGGAIEAHRQREKTLKDMLKYDY